MGADEVVDKVIEIDNLLEQGFDDVDSLLDAAKQTRIDLKELLENKLRTVIEKNDLNFGSLSAFASEIDAAIYNICNFIEKLEGSAKILANTKTMFSKQAAKNLKLN